MWQVKKVYNISQHISLTYMKIRNWLYVQCYERKKYRSDVKTTHTKSLYVFHSVSRKKGLTSARRNILDIKG